MPETKTCFAAIVGCPNVGKSSLLNRLLGQKVAIVTHRPQTTRTKITGVLTQGETQFVFTDTPGMHKPQTRLGQKMVRAVRESLDGVDVCVLVTEPFLKKGDACEDAPQTLRPAELELLERFRKEALPVILAINKIDLLGSKTEVLERIRLFSACYPFAAVVPVSAAKGDNLPALLAEIARFAAPSVHYFPEDSLTDQPERILAAEMIREKLLVLMDQEIPHESAVLMERMHERADGLLEMEAVIYCGKERHKGMIIGKQGAMLKEISTRARKDMERFFGCPVHLRCFVKVKEGWRESENWIREFGLD